MKSKLINKIKSQNKKKMKIKSNQTKYVNYKKKLKYCKKN